MNSLPQPKLFVNNDLRQRYGFGFGFADFYGYLMLPSIVVKQFGPRTMTLSALCSLPEVRQKGTTFRQITGIAGEAGLPVRTVKHHLDWLQKQQAVGNAGRHHRRTATRLIDPQIREAFKPGLVDCYPLPRFVLESGLTWNERLVLAFYCFKSYRFSDSPKKAIAVSQAETARQTGLQRLAVREATRRLVERGLIEADSNGIALRF